MRAPSLWLAAPFLAEVPLVAPDLSAEQDLCLPSRFTVLAHRLCSSDVCVVAKTVSSTETQSQALNTGRHHRGGQGRGGEAGLCWCAGARGVARRRTSP